VRTEANPDSKASLEAKTPEFAETTSPSWMDLRPEPEQVVKVSKKVGALVVGLAIVLCGVLAYSGISRQKQRMAAALNGPQKKVEPARPDDVLQGLTLNAPPANRPSPSAGNVGTTSGPVELQPGTPGLPTERVVVRNGSAQRPSQPMMAAAPPTHEASPEERALAAAYASEQQARLAPTSIRINSSSGNGGQGFSSGASPEVAPSLEALARRLTTDGSHTGGAIPQAANGVRTEYEEQNLQSQKEGFLEKARLGNVREDYLKSTRTAPMSRFEIKAGWEIPAVLEQALNSDLPGELKALVMSNVYDTASGVYLLIPQGSRLVGTYNSRITYGQTGVQVAWNRVIFPDASSVDLNGMNGLDAQGKAGLRDKVDRHYAQLVGFAVLTSMFDAALAITQNRQQSVLVYPSATQEAQSAAGREVSQLGTQIARRNLNVQPTVKVPVGYKFNVRVNRDILFEEPYRSAGPAQVETDRVRLSR
jgi:type IV secretory pathway VirB10-like protein